MNSKAVRRSLIQSSRCPERNSKRIRKWFEKNSKWIKNDFSTNSKNWRKIRKEFDEVRKELEKYLRKRFKNNSKKICDYFERSSKIIPKEFEDDSKKILKSFKFKNINAIMTLTNHLECNHFYKVQNLNLEMQPNKNVLFQYKAQRKNETHSRNLRTNNRKVLFDVVLAFVCSQNVLILKEKCFFMLQNFALRIKKLTRERHNVC